MSVVPAVYLDNSATTLVDPRVLVDMQDSYTISFGNPSSLHGFGRVAKEILETSRSRLAQSISARKDEVIFTSGGTESNNLALKGVALANRKQKNYIIVSGIEHDSVLKPAGWLSGMGFEITYLPVDSEGLVEMEALENSITSQTAIVSIMHANNEIGTIQPLDEIGKICHENDTIFHSDACQSLGKVKIDLSRMPVDLLSVNAHKIYGPKGIGALYIRDGIEIEPLQHGGGHERGIRSSTENIPGIVGFAKAAELCVSEFESEVKRETDLRDQIITQITERIPPAYINGHRTKRLCNNANFGFKGLEGEAPRILFALDDLGIAVSSGSACSANASENQPSHVLTALGRNPVEARGAMRITLGRFTTNRDVEYFLDCLPDVINQCTSF